MLSAPQGGPTLAQLFELRMVVECACAGMAAQRGGGNDLQAIRAALADMRRHAEDFASAAAAGPFRHAIVQAAHNPCLIGLGQPLNAAAGVGLALPHQAQASRSSHRRPGNNGKQQRTRGRQWSKWIA